MATFEQIREGELRPDQLEIGKVYRMEQYGRPIPDVPHRLIDESLGRFNKIWGGGIFMEFTIVAPGTSDMWRGRKIDIKFNTSPMDNYYWRFFQTAQDRIVPQFEQRALESVFDKNLDLGKAATWGLTKDLLAPSTTKAGGRKYKTRQTKLRRKKNKTKKNRRRTNRR
jgi:hypothetical protein